MKKKERLARPEGEGNAFVLDLMLPDMDGMEVLRELRSAKVATPVLILSGLAESENKVKGLGTGADDYLTKPFNKDELIARIQTTLRLKHTVDQKLGELGRIKDHFAKFVPEAVQRMVADDPESPGLGEKREQEVAVLFSISPATRA